MKVYVKYLTQRKWSKHFSFLSSPTKTHANWAIPYLAAAVKSLQSCPTLCDPIDGSPLGSPILGILQARILEWVAISFSNAWKRKVKMKCSTLSDPMDCSLPGSSIHGVFQARVLERGAVAFSEVLNNCCTIDMDRKQLVVRLSTIHHYHPHWHYFS